MRRDETLALDMLIAARDALRFSTGRSRAELAQDRQLQLATLKALETIGEAASRISTEFQAAHVGLPWRDIIAMRHKLVHDYFEVDLDEVWKVLTEDLDPLISYLAQLVPPEDEP